MLSALVMPGLGQAAQKRWVAAVFYSVSFLASFVLCMIQVSRILIAYYRLAFDPASTPQVGRALPAAGGLLLLAILLYLVNVLDAAWGYRQSCRRRAEARLRERLGGMDAGGESLRPPREQG